jgi:putative hemolysin
VIELGSKPTQQRIERFVSGIDWHMILEILERPRDDDFCQVAPHFLIAFDQKASGSWSY